VLSQLSTVRPEEMHSFVFEQLLFITDCWSRCI